MCVCVFLHLEFISAQMLRGEWGGDLVFVLSPRNGAEAKKNV